MKYTPVGRSWENERESMAMEKRDKKKLAGGESINFDGPFYNRKSLANGRIYYRTFLRSHNPWNFAPGCFQAHLVGFCFRFRLSYFVKYQVWSENFLRNCFDRIVRIQKIRTCLKFWMTKIFENMRHHESWLWVIIFDALHLNIRARIPVTWYYKGTRLELKTCQC